jgi:hypothetical protein
VETEAFGATETLRHPNSRRSQPVPDLSAISGNTLETQQHHKDLEPRIGWCRAIDCSWKP